MIGLVIYPGARVSLSPSSGSERMFRLRPNAGPDKGYHFSFDLTMPSVTVIGSCPR